jgi:hypothetical protein
MRTNTNPHFSFKKEEQKLKTEHHRLKTDHNEEMQGETDKSPFNAK